MATLTESMVHDFLLVFHCNYVLIFNRFQDNTIGRKVRMFYISPLERPRRNLDPTMHVEKLEARGYQMVKGFWRYEVVSIPYTRVTDVQKTGRRNGFDTAESLCASAVLRWPRPKIVLYLLGYYLTEIA